LKPFRTVSPKRIKEVKAGRKKVDLEPFGATGLGAKVGRKSQKEKFR